MNVKILIILINFIGISYKFSNKIKINNNSTSIEKKNINNPIDNNYVKSIIKNKKLNKKKFSFNYLVLFGMLILNICQLLVLSIYKDNNYNNYLVYMSVITVVLDIIAIKQYYQMIIYKINKFFKYMDNNIIFIKIQQLKKKIEKLESIKKQQKKIINDKNTIINSLNEKIDYKNYEINKYKNLSNKNSQYSINLKTICQYEEFFNQPENYRNKLSLNQLSILDEIKKNDKIKFKNFTSQEITSVLLALFINQLIDKNHSYEIIKINNNDTFINSKSVNIEYLQDNLKNYCKGKGVLLKIISTTINNKSESKESLIFLSNTNINYIYINK
jgi:hypothetical protein